MNKSIRFNNNVYIDSSGITHNKQLLNKILNFTQLNTEQIVGKWVDGKNIYRKVIKGSWGTQSYPHISTGITNLDAVVKIESIFTYGNANQYISTIEGKQDFYLDKTSNCDIVLILPESNGNATVTIYYTKTTN